MKIFETIHLILLMGFVVGVPTAAATRPSDQEFSWVLALKQSGAVVLLLIVLLLLNFAIGRLVMRSRSASPRQKSL